MTLPAGRLLRLPTSLLAAAAAAVAAYWGARLALDCSALHGQRGGGGARQTGRARCPAVDPLRRPQEAGPIVSFDFRKLHFLLDGDSLTFRKLKYPTKVGGRVLRACMLAMRERGMRRVRGLREVKYPTKEGVGRKGGCRRRARA